MDKILIVVNINNINFKNEHNVRYAAKCTDDMLWDVETAFEEIGKAVSEDTVEEIAAVLENGGKYTWKYLSFECANMFSD